ncbi:hypothetical protein ADICYQ_1805 [Cyclobacterium qasimii M12-11B]|uniref:Uncharacterized protein n=1 Tax=Cyclobacterium qasimii M12-11B TaxID=641524 RepID=S7VI07_9BACT|nr:hypothetical protein ADICYQ_1805 [Cyclobacterium qasimii M12-11B]
MNDFLGQKSYIIKSFLKITKSKYDEKNSIICCIVPDPLSGKGSVRIA